MICTRHNALMSWVATYTAHAPPAAAIEVHWPEMDCLAQDCRCLAVVAAAAN
jgi:hypothetical protein